MATVELLHVEMEETSFREFFHVYKEYTTEKFNPEYQELDYIKYTAKMAEKQFGFIIVAESNKSIKYPNYLRMLAISSGFEGGWLSHKKLVQVT